MVGLAAGLLVSSWFAVEGASTCPTPAQVGEALGAITEPGAVVGSTADVPRFTVRVEESTDGLSLELRDAGGARVGRRSFPPGGACEEKARASALVVAFWIRELRGRDTAPDRAAESPAAALTSSLAPPADPPAPIRRGPHLEVGAAFSAAVTGSTGAYGGALETLLAPRDRGLGGRLAVVGLSSHEVNVGPGVGRWQRLAAAPALNYRWVAGLWRVDVHLDALLAAVRLEGQGLDVNRSAWSFDPGVGAGLRVARVPRPGSWFAPFAAMQMWAWPRRHTLLVGGGVEHAADLPRIEGLFQVGLAVGRF
jgi:hypothetical protein